MLEIKILIVSKRLEKCLIQILFHNLKLLGYGLTSMKLWFKHKLFTVFKLKETQFNGHKYAFKYIISKFIKLITIKIKIKYDLVLN